MPELNMDDLINEYIALEMPFLDRLRKSLRSRSRFSPDQLHKIMEALESGDLSKIATAVNEAADENEAQP